MKNKIDRWLTRKDPRSVPTWLLHIYWWLREVTYED